jgi:hypothetical protein
VKLTSINEEELFISSIPPLWHREMISDEGGLENAEREIKLPEELVEKKKNWPVWAKQPHPHERATKKYWHCR